MNTLPLNLAFFTTTKGHFNYTDIYKKTLDSLFSQVNPDIFATKIAHIKVSEDTKDGLDDIRKTLTEYGIKSLISYGNWAHNQNHGVEYLLDICKMFSLPQLSAPYTLFMEDDFLFAPKDSLDRFFTKAIDILKDINVITVRFPRYTNEKERVANLMRKHNIPGKVVLNEIDSSFCYINDHSNNPFIARTRDLQVACNLIKRFPESFPLHPEHGFAAALKALSVYETPIALFNPKQIRVLHIGTKPGDEDSAEKELLAEIA